MGLETVLSKADEIGIVPVKVDVIVPSCDDGTLKDIRELVVSTAVAPSEKTSVFCIVVVLLAIDEE
jgi:hypothetical protein